LERVVEQVVAEITARGLKEVLLWGHSSGTALAAETAKKLPDRGVEVEHVFLAAQLLGDATDRRARITKLAQRSNADIVTDLSADSGYTELGELNAHAPSMSLPRTGTTACLHIAISPRLWKAHQ
jgi:surfactin synthase thioesterase subunit